MAEMFGHEKLKVYEKSLGFVGLRSDLLARIDRRVATCDHTQKGLEMLRQIAAMLTSLAKAVSKDT